ncbi:MAG: TatD family hydrolase [Kiritimatiellia bacterium]
MTTQSPRANQAYFFDSHVHFSADYGHDQLISLVERACAAGVRYMVAVGGSPDMNCAALTVTRLLPRFVHAAIGYDRDQAPKLTRSTSEFEQALAVLAEKIRRENKADRRIVALGEIGLDFHYSPDTATAQIELLRGQLELAERLGLPVIVHSRNADTQTLEELARHKSQGRRSDCRGVLHCFTGDRTFARKILDLGFYISFSGIVTFRNADSIRDALKIIPDHSLLIETDSPYLAAEPYRGRSNEPALLPAVAKVVAAVRACPLARIAELTLNNARRLFGWPKSVEPAEAIPAQPF